MLVGGFVSRFDSFIGVRVGQLNRVGHLGRVHTCSGREPDSSVPCARVRFASTRYKNRPAEIGSRPVKLKRRVHTATGTRTVLT